MPEITGQDKTRASRALIERLPRPFIGASPAADLHVTLDEFLCDLPAAEDAVELDECRLHVFGELFTTLRKGQDRPV